MQVQVLAVPGTTTRTCFLLTCEQLLVPSLRVLVVVLAIRVPVSGSTSTGPWYEYIRYMNDVSVQY